MPRITHLKTFDGALWAKLEMDHNVDHGAIHIFTDKEIRELRDKERKDVWREIEEVVNRYSERDD